MSQFFRASVGAVIINQQGQVLALERSDTAGAWQFPQGGLEAQEEPLAAAYREVQEETGLAPDALALLYQHPRLLSYELPPKWRTPKLGRGQTQRWFFFRLRTDPQALTLPCPGEFRQWRWLDFPELLPLVAPFRQEIYQELAAALSEIVAVSPAKT
jgi:putative (di)nucleoside polyphosphate hydrolase